MLTEFFDGIPWYAVGVTLACVLIARYLIRPLLGRRWSVFRNISAGAFLLAILALGVTAAALVFSQKNAAEPVALIAFACIVGGVLSFTWESARSL